jgi:(2S)-methylsuccinyl-CoA dehydrogenase
MLRRDRKLGRQALDIDILAASAQEAADTLLARATAAVRRTVTRDGKLDSARLESEQRAVHGLAWLATYAESVRQLVAYADRMKAEGRFGETEALLTRIGLSEYLAQMFGGIPMNQGEFVRPADFGLDEASVAPLRSGAVAELIAAGNTPALRVWSS